MMKLVIEEVAPVPIEPLVYYEYSNGKYTPKECYKVMLCARCVWKYNGGCSEWNGLTM